MSSLSAISASLGRLANLARRLQKAETPDSCADLWTAIARDAETILEVAVDEEARAVIEGRIEIPAGYTNTNQKNLKSKAKRARNRKNQQKSSNIVTEPDVQVQAPEAVIIKSEEIFEQTEVQDCAKLVTQTSEAKTTQVATSSDKSTGSRNNSLSSDSEPKNFFKEAESMDPALRLELVSDSNPAEGEINLIHGPFKSDTNTNTGKFSIQNLNLKSADENHNKAPVTPDVRISSTPRMKSSASVPKLNLNSVSPLKDPSLRERSREPKPNIKTTITKSRFLPPGSVPPNLIKFQSCQTNTPGLQVELANKAALSPPRSPLLQGLLARNRARSPMLEARRKLGPVLFQPIVKSNVVGGPSTKTSKSLNTTTGNTAIIINSDFLNLNQGHSTSEFSPFESGRNVDNSASWSGPKLQVKTSTTSSMTNFKSFGQEIESTSHPGGTNSAGLPGPSGFPPRAVCAHGVSNNSNTAVTVSSTRLTTGTNNYSTITSGSAALRAKTPILNCSLNTAKTPILNNNFRVDFPLRGPVFKGVPAPVLRSSVFKK